MKKMVTKKNLFFISIILVCLVGIGLVISPGDSPIYEVNGHSADDVLVMVGEYTMTLQEAIGDNLFDYSNTPLVNRDPSYTQELIHGCDAIEIFVSVNGDEMNLQDAINSLSSNPGFFCSGGGSFSSPINVGHSADEIKVIVNGEEMNLQKAIDDNKLCGCSPNWGQSCGGGVCRNPGTYNCGGICTGTTYQSVGTNCGSSTGCTWSCNGYGSCIKTPIHDCQYNYPWIYVGKFCCGGALGAEGECTKYCYGWHWGHKALLASSDGPSVYKDGYFYWKGDDGPYCHSSSSCDVWYICRRVLSC